MQVETVLDLRYNIAALTIAICAEEFMLPEKAFSIISDEAFHLKDDDLEDMIRLRNEGATYREIAEIYDSTDSNIFKRIKYYKAKRAIRRQSEKLKGLKKYLIVNYIIDRRKYKCQFV